MYNQIFVIGPRKSGKTAFIEAITEKLTYFIYGFYHWLPRSKKPANFSSIPGATSLRNKEDLERVRESHREDIFWRDNEPNLSIIEANLADYDDLGYEVLDSLTIFLSPPPPNGHILPPEKELAHSLSLAFVKNFGASLLPLLTRTYQGKEEGTEELSEPSLDFSKLPEPVLELIASKIDVSEMLAKPLSLKNYADRLLLKEYRPLRRAHLFVVNCQSQLKGKSKAQEPSEEEIAQMKRSIIRDLTRIGLIEGRRGTGVYIIREMGWGDTQMRNLLGRIKRILQRGYI